MTKCRNNSKWCLCDIRLGQQTSTSGLQVALNVDGLNFRNKSARKGNAYPVSDKAKQRYLQPDNNNIAEAYKKLAHW